MDSTEMLISELTDRIAKVNIEAAGWKVRASIAEAALAQLEATLPTEDDEVLDDIIEKGHGGTE